MEYSNQLELIRFLAAERARRGIKQTDMALKLGITQGYLSKIEQGQVPLFSFHSCAEYASQLGMRLTLTLSEE